MNKAKCGKMWNNSMNGFNLQSQLSLIAGTVISSNKQEIICTFVQHTIDCYDCFNLTFELLFCASSQKELLQPCWVHKTWTCSKVISVGGWFIRSSYFVESMLRYSRRLSCSMMFHVTSVCVCVFVVTCDKTLWNFQILAVLRFLGTSPPAVLLHPLVVLAWMSIPTMCGSC